MSFGEKLRELRKQRGMTQDELGEIIGVKKAAVQKLESGSVQSLKISNIKALCFEFNISPDELILEKEDLLAKEVKILENVESLYGPEFIEIISVVSTLNKEGQNKIIEYCIDIAASRRYNK